MAGNATALDAAGRFNREYPTSAAQALEASGERFFRSTDIDATGEDVDPLQPRAGTFRDYRNRERHRRYAVGVDVGFKQDATCIIVLDHTDDNFAVAHYLHLTPPCEPYEVAAAVEHVHQLFPRALVLVEDNSAGYVLRQSLNIPADKLKGFTTTQQSKARILDALYAEITRQSVCWQHDQCPELTTQMYHYRLPDQAIRQDAVLALALALEAVRIDRENAPGSYRVLQA